MDNAGGHGTIQAKSDFVSILQKEYNVIVDWQVANSPESNMLDLGAWMLMQSCVEMLHNNKVMEENVLTSGIRNAIFHLDWGVLQRIYDRWVKVLDLMLLGNGSNKLVETHQGKSEVIDLTQVDLLQHKEEDVEILSDDDGVEEEEIVDKLDNDGVSIDALD